MPHPSVKAPAAGTAAAGASKPAAAKKVADTKAPGLRLLSRMGKGAGAAAAKTGKADPKQKA
jgi:hypothetical protein